MSALVFLADRAGRQPRSARSCCGCAARKPTSLALEHRHVPPGDGRARPHRRTRAGSADPWPATSPSTSAPPTPSSTRRAAGIVLNEPSVIALNSRTGDVLAMGQEAWQMIGRTPGYIVAVRPLRQGAITDFDITQRMIRLLLQRAGVNRFNRPRVVICVPSAITEVERRAVTEAARRAGAADAQLIEQPMAAAIGAGPAHQRARRQHGDRRRRRHVRDRPHLARRRRRAAGGAGRLVRHRRRHPDLRAAGVRHRRRRAHGRGDQDGDRLGVADRRRVQGRGAGPRPDERPAEDGHPVARGGAGGDRRAGDRRSSTRSWRASARPRPSSPRT